MKKKILTMVALLAIVSIPFKVNAAGSCPTKTNYYLFHDSFSQWDEQVKSICGTEYLDFEQCLAKHPNARVTYDSDVVSTFINTIPKNANIISTNYILVTRNSSSNGSIENLEKYNSVWKQMLSSINSTGNIQREMTDANDSNIKYFLHKTWSPYDEINRKKDLPFFLDPTVNYRDYFTNIMDAVENSYIVDNDVIIENINVPSKSAIKNQISTNNINDPLTLRLQRSYSFPLADLKEGININNYRIQEDTITEYHLIHPSVYKITYDDCDSNQEYTVTYHSNDGKNSTNSNTVSLNSHTVKDNMFTRDGYNFIGWSTNKDATQGEASYQEGKNITVTDNLDLYAIWVSAAGDKGTTDNSKTGLGYSLGIIGSILAATGGGVVYFKKRNKFENI